VNRDFDPNDPYPWTDADEAPSEQTMPPIKGRVVELPSTIVPLNPRLSEHDDFDENIVRFPSSR
jgi:hypothetical protein